MATAYIFIGQSGAGKGTQVNLLQEKLKTLYPQSNPLHLETGTMFRAFIQADTYTATHTKKMIAEGKLPPPFLGVHMWAHFLMEQYDGINPILIDGTPRSVLEVPLFLSAVEFYGWDAHVINICVSDEWAYEKTVGRGREDDKNEHDVWGRIQWFHESVAPSIELLKASPHITYHTVHGEQTIAEVHKDICTTLGL